MHVKTTGARNTWDCDACGCPAHSDAGCGGCSCLTYQRTYWHTFLDWASR